MNPIQAKQIAKIARETDAAPGYSVVKQASADVLVKLGYIDVAGPEQAPPGLEAGTVAAKINAAGRAALTETPTAPAVKPTFAIETLSDLPVATRAAGGGRESLYPFEDLAAPTPNGQGGFNYSAFKVMDNEVASGDAFKSLGSSVSTANKKYSTEGAPVLDEAGNPVKGRGGHAKVERTYERFFKTFRIEGGVQVARTK